MVEAGTESVDGPVKSFALSNFGTKEGAAAEGTDESGGLLVTADCAASETPFWAAMEPKDLTPSAGFTGGTGADKEDMGAEASSIEPKVRKN